MNKTKLRENFEQALDKFNFVMVYDIVKMYCKDSYWISKMAMMQDIVTLFEFALKDIANGSSYSIRKSEYFQIRLYNSGNVYIEFIPVSSYIDWEK